MQFKVPQNIDMADRIVGPLTLIQFLYLLVGGIVDYVLFSVLAPINSGLFFAIGIPIAAFSLALAFLRIQDQPFGKFVLSFFAYLFKPKMRVWSKDGIETEVVIAGHNQKQETRVVAKPIKRSDLARLSQILDTASKPLPQTGRTVQVSVDQVAPR